MVKNKIQEEVKEEQTTIMVGREVYTWLESKKIHPRQSFNEVLEQIRLKEVL